MHKNYTFLTGAPGSRWSGIAQIITKNFNYNNEDETDWRVYRHGNFSGHKGSYFGPNMELGHNFHMLETRYGNDITEFELECNRAFDGRGTGTKMIKCHQFAYNLDWLYSNIPNSNILLVKRGNKECFDWWKQAGGWDITYPKYDWYVDDHHMKHYIEAENTLANLFVDIWEDFTEDWITDNFGKHSIKIDMKKYNDVKVSLVNTKYLIS